MNTKLFLLSLALVTVGACSKDDDDEQTSRMELLTSAAWKYENAGIDNNGDGNIDSGLPGGCLEDCETYNTILFNSNGTGTVSEGASKCDPDDPQDVQFTWSFNSSQSSINFTDTVFGGITGEVLIKTLTSSKLILAKNIDVGLPVTIPVVVHMTH